MDQVVEAILGRRRGLLGVVGWVHRRAARALSVSPVPAKRVNTSAAAASLTRVEQAEPVRGRGRLAAG